MRRVVLGLVLLAAGCGGAQQGAVSQLAEMERVRQAPAAKEAQTLAPQAFAKAEEERKHARAAQEEGDDVAAALYAERAMAGYSHAFVLARLAGATREEAEAAAAFAKAQEDARQLASARAAIEREGDELDKQLKVAREALAPPPSGPADPQREAARLVAARALATQARLLCGAARLLAPDLTGLADADKGLDDLDKSLEPAPKPVPIDAAARARGGCLGLLTKARRDAKPVATGGGLSSGDAGASASLADALLAELSAAGWEPGRDERGVVATLRGAFKGQKLSPEGETKLKELGRVAAAHPGFALQVVLHDDAASPSFAQERAFNPERADACVKALAAGGAAPARVRAEIAGTRSPVVDPKDTAHRSRNARVEVVFVAP